jgi:hypothetical protein
MAVMHLAHRSMELPGVAAMRQKGLSDLNRSETLTFFMLRCANAFLEAQDN